MDLIDFDPLSTADPKTDSAGIFGGKIAKVIADRSYTAGTALSLPYLLTRSLPLPPTYLLTHPLTHSLLLLSPPLSLSLPLSLPLSHPLFPSHSSSLTSPVSLFHPLIHSQMTQCLSRTVSRAVPSVSKITPSSPTSSWKVSSTCISAVVPSDKLVRHILTNL